MVMMFGGGIVLMFEGFLVLFLPLIIYGVGVLRSHTNPYRLVLAQNLCLIICNSLTIFRGGGCCRVPT